MPPAALPLQEFILNMPTNEASKFWIGGAAQTAKISAIFAQVGASLAGVPQPFAWPAAYQLGSMPFLGMFWPC